MSKFKAGDLALVVRCKDAPEMVGKCVELVEFVRFGDLPSHDSGWSPFSEDAWLVTGESLVAMTRYGLQPAEFTAFAERCLLPLRGDFHPEQQKAKEEEPCH